MKALLVGISGLCLLTRVSFGSVLLENVGHTVTEADLLNATNTCLLKSADATFGAVAGRTETSDLATVVEWPGMSLVLASGDGFQGYHISLTPSVIAGGQTEVVYDVYPLGSTEAETEDSTDYVEPSSRSFPYIGFNATVVKAGVNAQGQPDPTLNQYNGAAIYVDSAYSTKGAVTLIEQDTQQPTKFQLDETSYVSCLELALGIKNSKKLIYRSTDSTFPYLAADGGENMKGEAGDKAKMRAQEFCSSQGYSKMAGYELNATAGAMVSCSNENTCVTVNDFDSSGKTYTRSACSSRSTSWAGECTGIFETLTFSSINCSN